MIKVAIHKEDLNCFIIKLSTFFFEFYPLDFQSIMRKINEQVEGDQYFLIHTLDQVEHFSNNFKTPKDVLNFMIENTNQEIKSFAIGDRYYAIFNQATYEFFEGKEDSV